MSDAKALAWSTVRHRKWCAVVLSSAAFAGCSGDNGGPAHELCEQPSEWKSELEIEQPQDLDDDPNVLEVEIEAAVREVEILEGVLTEMWTYNGSVPGPLLRANRGDRLIVHFTNHLPEPTTVHWHGLRVPSSMDGTEAVQNPVLPGESFTYDFQLLDAGTFWYHPHMNSGAQVGYGLYGPLIVDDPDDPLSHEDVVVVLSDVSLDADGQLSPGDQSGWFGDYFGRQGNVLLVNGKVEPTLRIRPSLSQRWRLINAARSRFFGLAVPGGEMIQIASDAGLSDRPLSLERLVLHPSERAELVVTVEESDSTQTTVAFQDVDRFETGRQEPDRNLFHLELDVACPERSESPPEQLASFAPLDLNDLFVRRIVLGETPSGDLAINGVVFPGSADDPAHVGYVGDTEIWEIVNETPNHHPFHLHGFLFQVLDVGGVQWPVRQWKDTLNVPPEQTARFIVSYDDRPGAWMFHCHILGHAKLGMMSVLDIREHDTD